MGRKERNRCVWIGHKDHLGEFKNPINWEGGVVPQEGDDVVFMGKCDCTRVPVDTLRSVVCVPDSEIGQSHKNTPLSP